MKKTLLFALALNVICNLGTAEEKPAGYSQAYVIFINGARAGKETVTETIEGNGDRVARSESEKVISDGLEKNRIAHSTQMVLDNNSLKPRSYHFKYLTGTSGDSCEVDILGNDITRTLIRGGETSLKTASFKPEMVILDYDVYHQYDYLIHKYDHKKGGRQLFLDFIPLIGNEIQIALTFNGESALKYRKGELQVRKYTMEFVGLRSGMVMADKDGRLVRLMMPDQNLEVVREDLVPANR